MIINHIHIISFGKFNDKKMKFHEGFNLIYGLNEAGKSTVHAFIEAMFYGFIDVSKNRKTYLPKYDQYYNDTLGVYGGYITFTIDGESYTLFRNIKKNVRKDAVILTIEKTGKDITTTLDIDPVSKQPDIAKFIKLPYLLYKNTLSIAQLSSKTSSEASDELVSRLQNLTTSKSESISAQKALDNLKKAYEEIGSDKASTKLYRKTYDEVSALNSELEEAINSIESIKQSQIKLETLKTQSETKKRELATLKARLNRAQNALKRKHYLEALSIHEEINALKKEIKTLNRYENFDATDYENYLTLIAKKDTLNQDTLSVQESLIKKETFLNQNYPNEPKVHPIDLDKLSQDIKTVESLEESSKDQLLKNSYEKTKKKRDQYRTRLEKKGFKKLVLKVFNLLTFGLFLRITKKRLLKLETVLTKIEQKDTILKTYQVASCESLHALLEKETKAQIAFNHYQALLEDISEIKQSLKEKNSALVETLNTIKSLNERYDLTSLEDFKAYKAKVNRLKETKQLLSYKEDTLKRLLNGKSLEAFKEGIDFDLEDSSEDIEDLRKQITDDNEEIQAIMQDLTMLQTSIKEKLSLSRSVEAISYDLDLKEEKLKTLKEKRDKIQAAQALIERAVGKIEAQFAPVLNETIKDSLATLTKSRYQDIKVRKDLSFTLYAPQSLKKESETFFSSGTLDQIYLAIRLGIITLLNQEDKPLILDDIFTNYDSERLNEALKLLLTIPTRQVLLFTCHERERTLLNALSINYTMLEL
ncbi:MAG: ATP-binding protein [Candidatus Izemoplasmataceae bacterium]